MQRFLKNEMPRHLYYGLNRPLELHFIFINILSLSYISITIPTPTKVTPIPIHPRITGLEISLEKTLCETDKVKSCKHIYVTPCFPINCSPLFTGSLLNYNISFLFHMTTYYLLILTFNKTNSKFTFYLRFIRVSFYSIILSFTTPFLTWMSVQSSQSALTAATHIRWQSLPMLQFFRTHDIINLHLIVEMARLVCGRCGNNQELLNRPPDASQGRL